MPLIKDNTYHPPWWLHSGHFQTIYASQLRFVRHVRYRRERIDTPDGDFLDIDWSETGSERLVILSHGLEGHTQRSYILGMVRAVNQAGWDALAWNFRGCSEESNRLLKFYHSGSSDDLAAVISFARQKKRNHVAADPGELDQEQAEVKRVRVGISTLHAPHALQFLRGIWFCDKCGSYTRAGGSDKTGPKGLTRACAPPTRVGLNQLARLRKLQPPKPSVTFPF